MSSYERKGAVSGADLGAREYGLGGSIFARYAKRNRGLLIALMVMGFAVGITYRFLMDPVAERDPANYFRSGLHGVGVAVTAWVVQIGFASIARSSVGTALRQLPVAGELLIRSLVMTAALVIVGISLQFVLYAHPLWLRWVTVDWFTTNLPTIVAIGFAISLIIGVTTETGRLIENSLLTSVLLGTYHRPVRESGS